MECRIASVERSLTRCPSPWRSVHCSVTEVHPCREDQSIRIAVSTVTGRFMLKPDLTTTNYYSTKLYGSGLSSSQGGRGRDLRGIAIYYLIQLTIIQCCINLWCIIITFMLLTA